MVNIKIFSGNKIILQRKLFNLHHDLDIWFELLANLGIAKMVLHIMKAILVLLRVHVFAGFAVIYVSVIIPTNSYLIT